MPLTFALPPSDGLMVLKQGLQAIQAAQQQGPRGGGPLAVSPSPQAMKPLPVYSLGLDDLAAGAGPQLAQLAAWRYLLIDHNQARQAAELTPGPDGSQFNMLTRGFVPATEQAFSMADAQKTTYEIRWLRVPALYVMALWLHDTQGEQDRFIVLPPTFPPFQPFRPYTTADLIALLHQEAARKAPLEQQVAPG